MATSGKMRVRLGVWVGGRQTSATGDRSLGKILIRKSSHEIQNGKDGITPALFINELELAAAVVCALLQHNTVEPQMLDGNKFGQTRAGSTITFNFRKKLGLEPQLKAIALGAQTAIAIAYLASRTAGGTILGIKVRYETLKGYSQRTSNRPRVATFATNHRPEYICHCGHHIRYSRASTKRRSDGKAFPIDKLQSPKK